MLTAQALTQSKLAGRYLIARPLGSPNNPALHQIDLSDQFTTFSPCKTLAGQHFVWHTVHCEQPLRSIGDLAISRLHANRFLIALSLVRNDVVGFVGDQPPERQVNPTRANIYQVNEMFCLSRPKLVEKFREGL